MWRTLLQRPSWVCLPPLPTPPAPGAPGSRAPAAHTPLELRGVEALTRCQTPFAVPRGGRRARASGALESPFPPPYGPREYLWAAGGKGGRRRGPGCPAGVTRRPLGFSAVSRGASARAEGGRSPQLQGPSAANLEATAAWKERAASGFLPLGA